MRRFVFGLFTALGIFTALVILGAVLAVGFGVAALRMAAHPAGLPSDIILSADFSRGFAAGNGPDPLATLVVGKRETLRDFLETLERAGDDSRVHGLYVHIGGDDLGLATVQELRDAVHAFRDKGKFAIVFSESFGEFGPGTRPYYLATAFDEIWVQPLGSVGLIGLHAEVPFARQALDKLGVQAQFAHREEFKTAANTLTETTMTPAQREETEALLNATSSQIVKGIAIDRNLSESDVTGLIDKGPLLAEEAKSAKLIDRIGYRDEAVEQARKRAGSGAEFVAPTRYLGSAGRPHNSGPKIALIYANGLITQEGASSSLAGSNEVSARELTRAFRDAFRDSDVRAILFRIDSPGGSAVASETIWREVMRARERGKPVIVSMGDVAGSGGYYIAAPADKIVAEPATLTGSIGVLAGKVVIGDLLDKIGITGEAVQRGANSGMFTSFKGFTPTEWNQLGKFLDATYAGFKQRVADGRHMSAEQVEAVAKGRVWSGSEAKEHGLVDQLGGYETALQLAREAANLPPDKPFRIVVFPRQKSAIEAAYDRLANPDRNTDTPSAAMQLAQGMGNLLSAVATLSGDNSILRMPAIGDLR
ncbi:MAG: signal peptide peptidase SppA [Alphaproteobacteria bacterium]|nr:signal peptide peptidase SppA [Alphaproteobacteria bacterium]